jgi:hypothetical protein
MAPATVPSGGSVTAVIGLQWGAAWEITAASGQWSDAGSFTSPSSVGSCRKNWRSTVRCCAQNPNAGGLSDDGFGTAGGRWRM